jgi:hypothetical protein
MSAPPKFVKCPEHGKKCRGFIVCIHVLERGAKASFVELPGVNHPTLGCITCEKSKAHHPESAFRLVCEPCAYKRGWVDIPGRVPEGAPS